MAQRTIKIPVSKRRSAIAERLLIRGRFKAKEIPNKKTLQKHRKLRNKVVFEAEE